MMFLLSSDLHATFEQNIFFITKSAELAFLNITHPYYISVDAFFVGLSAVIIQPNSKKWMQMLSYISKSLSTQEQKSSTDDCHLLVYIFWTFYFEFKKLYNYQLVLNVYNYRPPKTLKQNLYLVTREGKLRTQKQDSDPILAGYGNNQFTLKENL